MSTSVEKLSFDNKDFKFMAAYGQYSEKFNVAQSDERRTELNEAITQLHMGTINYPDFYSTLDRETDERNRFHRARINTSRKFEYRKKERKTDRIKRHK
jgi:hypothetical protein